MSQVLNNEHDKPIQDSSIAPELEGKFFAKYFWQGEGIPQTRVDERTFEWTTGWLSVGVLSFIKLLNQRESGLRIYEHVL